MTSLSVLTLCSRRWCSSATTPTTRREPSRSSSDASPRSTSRSLARSSLYWTSPRCRSKRRYVASRSSMATNHNLSRGLLPSMGSYISLGNSGRPARVTGRMGSPLPRRAVASVASGTSRAEEPKPGRKDVPRVALAEAPPTVPPAIRSRHETAPATTVASLAIVPRSVDSLDAARPTSQVEEEEPALLLTHASIELSPAAAALLHLDEPRAHALLGDGSSQD
jgi:hypothetical protein